ncbi:MAG: hypothetical protein NVSMB9_12030 [Isosphaeraceae bacterium]
MLPLPRAAVVYNVPVLPLGHPDSASEHEVVAVSHAVAESLAKHGYRAFEVGAGPPLIDFLGRLLAETPDLVFNLVEGFGGQSAGATHMTSLFELLGLPYTGSSTDSLAICVSKERTKALLRGHGLPTAASFLVEPCSPVPVHDWSAPVIVKPDSEDGSLGIDQASVATNAKEVAEQVERVRKSYGGSVLIESYLSGPEFNVGVIALPELRALPIAEVAYTKRPTLWPILTYAAKWDDGSVEDLASRVECPARIDRSLAERLGEIAVAAFRVTGCRDYARIDLRLDGQGEPMILEVNPNPDLSPSAGLARAAQVAGLEYPEFMAAIALQALLRRTPH